MSNEVAKQPEKPMEFIPFGASDPIKLSLAIVKSFLAVPTKSGRTCSDRDAMKFMMLCRAKGLNPFEGDAFLIGYDARQQDGSIIPTFSLITAHQAFLKRAELHPEYDGMKSGLIILNDDDKTTRDTEGDFHLADDRVLGGWATVFFKTRKNPMQKRLRLARFNKGFGVWKDDPAGMVVKCAEADALRSAFPTKMGGMYLRHEFNIPVETPHMNTASDIPSAALVEVVPLAQENQQQEPPTEQPKPEKVAKTPEPKTPNVRDELAQVVTSEGYTFDHLVRWGLRSGNIPGADSMGGFQDIPEKIAVRLLRNKSGLLTDLAAIKAEAGQ